MTCMDPSYYILKHQRAQSRFLIIVVVELLQMVWRVVENVGPSSKMNAMVHVSSHNVWPPLSISAHISGTSLCCCGHHSCSRSPAIDHRPLHMCTRTSCHEVHAAVRACCHRRPITWLRLGDTLHVSRQKFWLKTMDDNVGSLSSSDHACPK